MFPSALAKNDMNVGVWVHGTREGVWVHGTRERGKSEDPEAARRREACTHD